MIASLLILGKLSEAAVDDGIVMVSAEADTVVLGTVIVSATGDTVESVIVVSSSSSSSSSSSIGVVLHGTVIVSTEGDIVV